MGPSGIFSACTSLLGHQALLKLSLQQRCANQYLAVLDDMRFRRTDAADALHPQTDLYLYGQ